MTDITHLMHQIKMNIFNISAPSLLQIIYTGLLIISSIVLFNSCETETPVEIKENYTLILSHDSHKFEAEGGDLSFTIKSTKTITTKTNDLITSEVIDIPYSVEISDDWLTFLGNFNRINAEENIGDERTASLTFSIEGSNIKKVLMISQKGIARKLVMYVSPLAKGNGSGETVENAAYFMNNLFWTKIKKELQERAVDVNFVDGDYDKAYIENGLILSELGDKNNKLTINGGENVIFNLPLGHLDKSDVIRLNNCQNIDLYNLHFKGAGRVQYSLRITGPETNNILIESCSWTDMHGVIYGATGSHHKASNVTYKNCTFKRIGFSGGSHMIYNAYGPQHISVIDSHFEDCKGDYIRFRADTEFGIVNNSTFIRNEDYPDVVFIAIPCFNDVDPGDERFGTNFSFTENTFKNNSTTNSTKPISFYHQGFSPKEYRYLLTRAEGDQLLNGREVDRIRILKSNFGIDVDKIRIQDNTFSNNIINIITVRSNATYGAMSLGWEGTTTITDLIKSDKPSFDWEVLEQ